MPTLWPIEDGRDCVVPSVSRSVTVPPIGARPAYGNSPYYDAMDPADIDVLAWDWSAIAFPGDPIVSASVSTVTATLIIGTTIIYGTTVQAFVGPSTATTLTYEINCQAAFASGRVLDWDVELTVQPL